LLAVVTDGSHSRIKLSEAARQLGCHVETLRERVRHGLLEVERGPHGAYFVTAEALARMPAIQRSPVARPFAPEQLAASWDRAERLVGWSKWTREPELQLLQGLRDQPSKSPRLYRLVSVQLLQGAGLTFTEIAGELGITARHARRLAARSVSIALRKEIYKQTELAKRAAARAARPTVAEIRRRLRRVGMGYHARSAKARLEMPFPLDTPEDPRQAFVVKRLTVDERRRLLEQGLTAAQVSAIELVGLGNDELNFLLLHGLPAEHS
jgi:hypothetical protein